MGQADLEAAIDQLFSDQASGLAIVLDAQDFPVGMHHAAPLRSRWRRRATP